MPALYALGQHAALAQFNATLREGEMLFAYLDDTHVLCDPDRVAEIFVQVQHALFHQTGVQVNLGKTKVWNGAAVKPTNMQVIGDDAWKGEGLEEERGLVVLGVPVGPCFRAEMACRQEGIPFAVALQNPSGAGTYRARGCSS